MKKLLVTFALTATCVLAQAQPGPESMKAAEELTKTVGLEKQMQSSFGAMLPMIQALSQRMQLSPADASELEGIYREWFTKDLDQAKLKDSITRLYAESFTKDELVELTAFYKSPLGQKTLVAMPDLMKKSSLAGMEEAKSKQALLQDRLKPFMEKHQKAAPAPQAPPQPVQPVQPQPAPQPAR